MLDIHLKTNNLNNMQDLNDIIYQVDVYYCSRLCIMRKIVAAVAFLTVLKSGHCFTSKFGNYVVSIRLSSHLLTRYTYYFNKYCLKRNRNKKQLWLMLKVKVKVIRQLTIIIPIKKYNKKYWWKNNTADFHSAVQ